MLVENQKKTKLLRDRRLSSMWKLWITINQHCYVINSFCAQLTKTASNFISCYVTFALSICTGSLCIRTCTIGVGLLELLSSSMSSIPAIDAIINSLTIIFKFLTQFAKYVSFRILFSCFSNSTISAGCGNAADMIFCWCCAFWVELATDLYYWLVLPGPDLGMVRTGIPVMYLRVRER